jgi:hypothetical protein
VASSASSSALRSQRSNSPRSGVEHVAAPAALGPLDLLAHEPFLLHPLQERVEHTVVHAPLARKGRRELALQLVAVHRLVDQEPEYRVLQMRPPFRIPRI